LSVLNLESLQKILDRLKNGQPLAIPTETVYGLAACIDQPLAIRQIFAIKGRPVNHPLIIHVSDLSMASKYAHLTNLAMEIGQHFWPGPLTLILPKKNTVPDEVTGGLNTVGVRIPNHPTTLAIIQGIDVPLAAPSANRFGKTSPTSPEHVLFDFNDAVPVVDGGECAVGIESTILDLSVHPPAIRRLGAISQEDLQQFIPEFGQSHTPTSGTHEAHYAPSTALLLSNDVSSDRRRLEAEGLSVATIVFEDSIDYAQSLYAELRRLDQTGVDILVAAVPKDDAMGQAVLDRLSRAAVGSNRS
jgi:L-threonylcarbamoyladenylate synthase